MPSEIRSTYGPLLTKLDHRYVPTSEWDEVIAERTLFSNEREFQGEKFCVVTLMLGPANDLLLSPFRYATGGFPYSVTDHFDRRYETRAEACAGHHHSIHLIEELILKKQIQMKAAATRKARKDARTKAE